MDVQTIENEYDGEGLLVKQTTRSWQEPDPGPGAPPTPPAPTA